MTLREHALHLARRGFYVFPLVPGSKLPAIKEFTKYATRDESEINRYWAPGGGEYNIGIATTKFGDGEALVVVDIDNKEGKHGAAEVIDLEIEGKRFPKTFTQRTPTGGEHFVYRSPRPVKQGAGVLGPSIDIRSSGGYIVGAGSVIGGVPYTAGEGDIAECPQWILDACGPARSAVKGGRKKAGVKFSEAAKRAIHYLENEAPFALEGAGGDQTTFQVACRVKDFGVEAETCFNLLLEYWNPRCQPPWDADQLLVKVENAYRYGAKAIGEMAPEAVFAELAIAPAAAEEMALEKGQHPFDKLNESYAFVTAGGGHHILWETTDRQGRFKLEHLFEATFHKKFAAWTMTIGDGKSRPVTELWMKSEKRRSYDGICFAPGLEVKGNWYNLWKGFAVEPYAAVADASQDDIRALNMFLEHALKNVCLDDFDLFTWLMGYFAHMVQRPFEKPLVALVFKGMKGVGKNALVERIGHLFGGHSVVVSDRRYLLGNFNGFLERTLLFTLDEAFWSGDKQAEGVLKSLITGSQHMIEHKGKEPYAVENCTRVCIIGNEEWLVPATHDERRFAVFEVGEGRQQDREFFKEMRVKMEAGGYRLLLRHLLDFDLTGIDVNAAPATEGLHMQKLNSLPPVDRWWHDSLRAGRVIGAEFLDAWPGEIDRDSLRRAVTRYYRDNGITSRSPQDSTFGRSIHKFCPSVVSAKRRDGKNLVNIYRLPPLEKAREQWEKHIGHKENWE